MIEHRTVQDLLNSGGLLNERQGFILKLFRKLKLNTGIFTAALVDNIHFGIDYFPHDKKPEEYLCVNIIGDEVLIEKADNEALMNNYFNCKTGCYGYCSYRFVF